jgi:hypothetical protein
MFSKYPSNGMIDEAMICSDLILFNPRMEYEYIILIVITLISMHLSQLILLDNLLINHNVHPLVAWIVVFWVFIFYICTLLNDQV